MVHYLGKREAEAEAEPSLLYAAGLPALAYGYGYPLAYTAAVATGGKLLYKFPTSNDDILFER